MYPQEQEPLVEAEVRRTEDMVEKLDSQYEMKEESGI
jgi:hypothetical protein